MLKVLLKNIQQSSSILKSLYLVVFLLLAFNIFFDCLSTVKYGGVDLRDKIVGSRILLTDQPMYHSWWKPGDSERFLNPQDDPRTPLSLYTGTPFQSMAFLPLAVLKYQYARYLWLVLQYLFLGLTVWFFLKKVRGDVKKSLLLLGGITFFFLSTDQWHMHIERGQLYILFTLLIGGLYFTLTSDSKYKDYQAGVLLSLLVLLKPTYAIFGIPFFFKMKIKLLAASAATVILAGLLFLATNTTNRWIEYSEAMKEWQAANLDLNGAVGQTSTEDLAQMPKIIEGLTNLNQRGSFFSENSCLQHIIFSLTGTKIPTSYFYLLAIGLMGLILGLLIPSFKYFGAGELVLLGFILWFVTTICLPAPRFVYQYIHWLIPMSFIAINYDKYDARILLILLIGLTLGIGIRFYTISIPYLFLVGELFLLLGVFLVLFTERYKQTPQESARKSRTTSQGVTISSY